MTIPVHSTATAKPSISPTIDAEIDAIIDRHPQLRREGGREFALAILRFCDAARAFSPPITTFGLAWHEDFAAPGHFTRFGGLYASQPEQAVRS